MMQRMRLILSIFRSSNNLSKEVEETEKGEEEGPCTSYSHREAEQKHEYHLEFKVLSGYLAEYRKNPRVFQETLSFPHYIQQKEERRPYSHGMMKGNRFLLSTFDGSLTCAAEAWVKKLEAFFLLHPVVDREAVAIAVLQIEGEAKA